MDEKKYLDDMNSINNFIDTIKNSSMNIVNIYKEMIDNSRSINNIIDIMFDNLKLQFKQMKNKTGITVLIDYLILEESNEQVIEELINSFINVNYINYLLENKKINILNKLYEKTKDKNNILQLVNEKANKLSFFDLTDNSDLNKFIINFGLDLFHDKEYIINNLCDSIHDEEKTIINPIENENNIYLKNYDIISKTLKSLKDNFDINNKDLIKFIEELIENEDMILLNIIYTNIIPQNQLSLVNKQIIFPYLYNKPIYYKKEFVNNIQVILSINIDIGLILLTDVYEYFLSDDRMLKVIKNTSDLFNKDIIYNEYLYMKLKKNKNVYIKDFKSFYIKAYKNHNKSSCWWYPKVIIKQIKNLFKK